MAGKVIYTKSALCPYCGRDVEENGSCRHLLHWGTGGLSKCFSNYSTRALCYSCGHKTGKLDKPEYAPFCTKQCAANWAIENIWDLVNLKLDKGKREYFQE